MKRLINLGTVFILMLSMIIGTNVLIENVNAASSTGVLYRTHVQSYGWQDWRTNGAMSGTEGEAKRLEAIEIKLANTDISGSIDYCTHVQSYGWQNWRTNGAMSGTSGEAKRLEAIKIKLTGELAIKYDIYYRVHAQSYGWLGWAKNGEPAGTEGLSKRLEAIEIVLVKKDMAAPGSTTNPFVEKYPDITYRTHVQSYGWQDWRTNGAMSGTEGEAKRLEAIEIKLANTDISGSIDYRTHVQSYGWQDWRTNGAMSGTSGEAKRLEAIKIKLTGELAIKYDIYYRVHAQSYGWLGWAKNGEPAGTEGLAKRLEAIEIKLVKKGDVAPGNTANAYMSESILVNSLIELINYERTKNGCAALIVDDRLMMAASTRADELIKKYSHFRPDGSTCFSIFYREKFSYVKAGENIARGYNRPEDVVAAWMKSPGHKANILDAKFNKIGVAYTKNTDGTGFWEIIMSGMDDMKDQSLY